MEITAPDKRQYPVSVCQSLGSTFNCTSQSRKVSIGIMVDKTPKMGSCILQEEQSSLPFKQRSSIQEKSAQGIQKKVMLREDTSNRRDRSPWVSTRSKNNNQTSLLQPEDRQHIKLGIHNLDSRRENDGTVEREKIIMAESCVPNKERVDTKVANASSEALKRKLWEVLGSAPLQSKKVVSPQVTKENMNHLVKEQDGGCNGGENGRTRLSDTIETDSKPPSQAVNRPITRSLTQKKQDPRYKFQSKFANIQRQPSSSTPKNKRQVGEKKVFSFDGQDKVGTSYVPSSKNLPEITNGSSRKILQIEPRRLLFPRKSTPSKTMKAIEKKCATSSPLRLVPKYSAAVSGRNSTSVPLGNPVSQAVNPDKIFPGEKEQNPSPQPAPTMKAAESINASPPKTSSFRRTFFPSKANINGEHQSSLFPQELERSPQKEPHESPSNALPQGSSSTKNGIDSLTEKNTVAKRKHATDLTIVDNNDKIFSPPKVVEAQGTDTPDSPTPVVKFKKIFLEERMAERTCNWPTLQRPAINLGGFIEDSSSLKSESPAEDTNTDSSMKTKDASQSPSGDAECRFNDANSKENSERSGMNRSCEEVYGLQKIIQVSWTDEPSKEDCKANDNGDKEIEGTNESPEIMEQFPEDNFLRAVSELAKIFEQIKTKIKLHANKKNSKILSSLKDKLQMQLHEIESQIQSDLRKLSSRANSKRKHLESTFHEQHEKLKAIKKKFEEEVNGHLLECRATLTELEAFCMESKGTAERQCLLHRKLIMQMEETMETQLSDADRSMLAIQKVAREKMNGLKYIMQEFLNEGTLGG